jgi:hypothetical protein
LHGGGLGVAEVCNGFDDRSGEAEFFERIRACRDSMPATSLFSAEIDLNSSVKSFMQKASTHKAIALALESIFVRRVF